VTTFHSSSITYSVKGTWNTDHGDTKEPFPHVPLLPINCSSPPFTQTIMGYYAKYISGGKIRQIAGPVLKAAAVAAGNYIGARVKRAASATYTKTKKSTKAKSTRRSYATSANYRGPFTSRRAPLKRKNQRDRNENYYATHGCTTHMEVSGTVADQHCVYLGHSSFPPEHLLRTVIYSILRKLYHSAMGFEPSNIREKIVFTGSADGHTVHVQWNTEDGTINGSLGSAYVAVTGDMSIVDVGDLSVVYDNFKDVATTDSVTLTKIWISSNGDNRMLASLNLTNMTVDVFARSQMKIQNVTVPVAGAEEETDVNNCPLQGRVYDFKHFNPTNVGLQGFTFIDSGTGLVLRRSTELALAVSQHGPNAGFTFREPPPSKTWTNCSKSVAIRLEPGTIKSDTIIFRKTMKLNKFLWALRIPYSGGRIRRTTIGTHHMLALEKIIHVSGTADIKCFYECEYVLGACVRTHNAPAIYGKFQEIVNYNNTG